MVFDTLFSLLKERNLTLGSVESLTGGSFASKMTSMPGASRIFKGALVTYMTEEKVRLLGIPYDLVDEHGVVSDVIAMEMASRGQKLMSVDYCVSFTGNAGPSAMEDKPVGRVYIAVAHAGQVTVVKCQFSGTRDEIRNQCLEAGANLLLSKILGNN